MESRDVAQGPIIEPRWLDVDTAAKYLCMSGHAIYHRVNRCQLPFIRDGRRVRFDRHALDRWMSKGVLGGQVQERWPRQLFVDPSLGAEALDHFLETGKQKDTLHWIRTDAFARETVWKGRAGRGAWEKDQERRGPT